MKIIAAAVLAMLITNPASAAQTGRDAAMRKCNDASRQHPRGKYYDWDSGWIAYYRSCMHDAGYME
jgi:hypothetical protein